MSLADNQCVPCRGGVPPLEPAKVQELLGQLGQGWAFECRRAYRAPVRI